MLARTIILLCHTQDMRLLCRHIAGRQNVKANWLSCQSQVNTGNGFRMVSVPSNSRDHLESVGQTADHCTSAFLLQGTTAKCRLSPSPDDMAWAMDTLSISWTIYPQRNKSGSFHNDLTKLLYLSFVKISSSLFTAFAVAPGNSKTFHGCLIRCTHRCTTQPQMPQPSVEIFYQG